MIGIVLSFRMLAERFDGKLMLVLDYSVVRVELWFVYAERIIVRGRYLAQLYRFL